MPRHFQISLKDSRVLFIVGAVFFTFQSVRFSITMQHSESAAYERLLQLETFADAFHHPLDDGKYRILCTTIGKQMQWGSYQIRCRDLKKWADRCARDAKVYLSSHEQTNQFFHLFDRIAYNSSVSIKSPFNNPSSKYGRVFLDVVDNYAVKERDVNPRIEVIVQNHYHADDYFPNRKSAVVEHWYNSYPQDMMSDEPVHALDIPTIQPVSTLKMSTVWTNKDQPCPALDPIPNLTYQCIDEVYTIRTWYDKYFNLSIPGQQEKIDSILDNSRLGPGRLYYELFWLYDVLVIPVKTAFKPKLRYGNVQRAVSQFRSGVPVLLEIYGEVLEEFMEQYNYTCAFILKNTTLLTNTTRQYWTFEEAAEAMKSPELRRKCQEEGFQITKDYSPSAIAKKFLRTLGYQGGFNCSHTEN